MHYLEKNILVRSDDGLGCLIGAIEQFLGDEDNIIDCIFVVLEEGKCKGSKSVVKRKAIVRYDHPLSIIDDGSLLD